jgi:hypothetical protein
MQMPLFDRWIDSSRSHPADGQLVLAYTEVVDSVTEKPTHRRRHISFGGKLINEPTVLRFKCKLVNADRQPIDELPRV